MDRAKNALLIRYDELLRSLDAAGSRPAAAKVREEMKVFRSDSIVNGRDEMREGVLQYGRSLKSARDALAAAYSEAITNYTKAHELNQAKKLQAELAEMAPDARLVSLECFGSRGQYLSHANFLGCRKPASNDETRINATFEIVPGLANGNCISFRSVNVPNYYLAHGDFRIRLQKREDSDGFRQNGTFKQVKGLAEANAASFESVNYPGYYIHARGENLYIDKFDGSAPFRREATFAIVEPLFKLW